MHDARSYLTQLSSANTPFPHPATSLKAGYPSYILETLLSTSALDQASSDTSRNFCMLNKLRSPHYELEKLLCKSY